MEGISDLVPLEPHFEAVSGVQKSCMGVEGGVGVVREKEALNEILSIGAGRLAQGHRVPRQVGSSYGYETVPGPNTVQRRRESEELERLVEHGGNLEFPTLNPNPIRVKP